MNAAFRQVIAAKDAERLELFLATTRRLGTAVQNVEKGLLGLLGARRPVQRDG